MTSIRERLERVEEERLHSTATRSSTSIRSVPEPRSDVRTEFQRDRDRVIHSKAFRRLKHKTQVFLIPDGDHVRTRMTHTLEVSQIARTIARALFLNEDLVEAITLAHDLGHTPFGHAGERVLAEYIPGFIHSAQSLRVVERIESNGSGLNLTDKVREGISHHSKPEGAITGAVVRSPLTPEAQIAKISDALAYINHDLDDSIRAGVIEHGQVPADILDTLGRTHGQRINTLVCDIVETSSPNIDTGAPNDEMIKMSPEIHDAANRLRNFLFDEVYAPINRLESTIQAQNIVRRLFEDSVSRPESIPEEFARALGDEPVERVAADYVAGMTDRYAMRRFKDLYIPKFWSV